MSKPELICPIEDLIRVPRKDLIEGIFGRFDQVLEYRLHSHRRNPETQQQLSDLFSYISMRYDWRDYAEIQRRHLATENRKTNHNLLKYLNAAFFLEQKLSYLQLSGVRDCLPGQLLDLGAGPCHFGVICKFYGWDVQALDHPMTGPGRNGAINHLYHDLAEFWGIPRVLEAVRARQPLRLVERQFKAITAFMINFNSVSRRGELTVEWSVDDWMFLLDDLRTHHLTADGLAFLNPLERLTSPAIWQAVARHADQPVPYPWAARFSDFASLDRLAPPTERASP